MTNLSPILRAISLSVFFGGAVFAPTTTLASGGAPRAWVSNLGTDAPGCGPVASPCRQLQYAHDNIVAPGGSIYVKDPAGFLPLVIRNAISIINDGSGTAAIFAPSSDAIDIQAGANDAVFIRGLVIDGVGAGNNGVNLTSGGSLTLSNCVIKGFGASAATGVIVQPSSGAVQVNVYDTNISSNSYVDVWLVPSGAASVDATFKNVTFDRSQYGLALNAFSTSGYANATVEHSVATGNSYGVWALGASSNARLIATDVNASHNQYGFYIDSGAVAYFSGSVATENTSWGVTNVGAAFTLQNNLFRDNANNVYGSLIPIGPGD